ncbi:UPF0149 family protein [Pseudothauera nasutitermitis]|uniref:UPF0149 family protein n=1 Tax=Pseudothauera nasutitermitis TaxID=2565930 RepID=A0A4S4B413_9RHOO|nr:UPF0149 family protein [Pseudothauera nasutitermitis]THF66470.1 UPF0149 family protein [Pseudothauera nasutitermitis]
MNQQDIDAHLLSDDEFEALEELLVSDAVPEDCMDLEMLDGFLAAVVVSPVPMEPVAWLPAVWSAHGEEISFGSGRQVQQAIRLVLRYHNELAVSIGEEEGWEPFCFAAGEGDTLAIGEEWMAGFTQGLELWPEDWEAGVPAEQAGAVREEIAAMATTWGSPAADSADEETRLLWLEEAGEAVARIRARWREAGLPLAGPVAVDAPAAVPRAGPGRNEPCPCGSGKKYKKCCGAES